MCYRLISSVELQGDLIELDFPINKPVKFHSEDISKPLAEIVLGSHQSLLVDTYYSSTTKKLVLVLDSEVGSYHFCKVAERACQGVGVLAHLVPDPKRMLAAHDGAVVTGVSVTCPSCEEGVDFFSRCYAVLYDQMS